jgi:hypothetical protein
MGIFFDGERHRGCLPENSSYEDMLSAGLSEGDAEQIIAFREFLRVAKRGLM